MTHEIRVSRHGLTKCPACLEHIRLHEDWVRTTCPFCSASLLTATRQGPSDLMGVLRSVHQKTGGALAASLLSFGLATGCEDAELQGLTARDAGVESKDAGDDVRDAGVADAQVAHDAGSIADAGAVVDAGLVDAGEPIPSPEYGKPPDDAGVAPDAALVDAGEPIPEPHYGGAPTDGGIQRIDAGEDGGVIAPLYGGSAVDAGG